MAFLALFLRESSKQTCLQPDSGVYSIETAEARRIPLPCELEVDSGAAGEHRLRIPPRPAFPEPDDAYPRADGCFADVAGGPGLACAARGRLYLTAAKRPCALLQQSEPLAAGRPR
jgi:hypothetical protein